MVTFDTDCFGFGAQEMFEVLRETLPEDRSKTQNIIECKDDMLFAWDPKNCCVLSLNWRAAKAKDDGSVKFQRLFPSSPQNFTVEKVTASQEGSFLALSGRRGVFILELPQRWGPNGQYREGKSKIICSSCNLDERFFVNNVHLEVLQVRWHPASPNDSHLLVLLSNNSIRVYDDTKLRHVWPVGPIPCALPPTGAQFSYLNILGDTAVDFDIAPPRVVTANDNGKDVSLLINDLTLNTTTGTNEKVEWPLVILRGNGSIYVVLIGIDTEKPHIQGPLSMFPQTLDNYGVDSCSIIVIPSMPPTVIIAESTGKLHHTLLIESEVAEDSFSEVDSTLTIYPNEYELHVLETVELELGLTEIENKEQNLCPIHLKRDPIIEGRYFAYHNTGLHAVTLHFVRQLQIYAESNDANAENQNLFSTPSHAEYLVCTKAIDSSKANAVLGLVLLQSPSGLALLLASGQVVSLNLINDSSFLREYSLKDSTATSKESSAKNLFDDSFESHIRNILTPQTSHPILKLDKSSEPSPKEALDLLIQSTQILREQYFARLKKAHEELQKRLKLQEVLKQQQQDDVVALQKEKELVRTKAEQLAELYDDAYERQQILMRRAQEVVRLAAANISNTSMAEQDFRKQIEKIANITKSLAEKFAMSKKKIDNQDIQIQQQQEGNGRTKKLILLPKKEASIKEILTEVTSEIEGQIIELKRIKTALNLS